jgi:hypothetical protein
VLELLAAPLSFVHFWTSFSELLELDRFLDWNSQFIGQIFSLKLPVQIFPLELSVH